MTRIYISSTYQDLRGEREVVYRTLLQLHHDVIAMEDYVATDKRPVDKCLDDVQRSDIYVGIFAFRYGYIPPGQPLSITELELRKAIESDKPCLLFLLDPSAPWPRSLMDADLTRIDSLRDRLSQDFVVSTFSEKELLARLVALAVTNQLSAASPPNHKTPEGGDADQVMHALNQFRDELVRQLERTSKVQIEEIALMRQQLTYAERQIATLKSELSKESEANGTWRFLTQLRNRFAADHANWSSFRALNRRTHTLLKSLETIANQDLIADVLQLCTQWKDFYTGLPPGSALYSMARLNEIVLFDAARLNTTTAFAAGQAENARIQEPYRTQIRTLPANACFTSYRSLSALREARLLLAEDAAHHRTCMEQLRQMQQFADRAWSINKTHPYANYMALLARLLLAYEERSLGHTSASEKLVQEAEDLLSFVPEPTDGVHYMYLQYHRMNFEEFDSLREIKDSSRLIYGRLAHLRDRALSIAEAGTFQSW